MGEHPTLMLLHMQIIRGLNIESIPQKFKSALASAMPQKCRTNVVLTIYY